MTATQCTDLLFAIWTAARAEANVAYDAWSDAGGSDAYTVYRAAEDRSDAAELALAAAARPVALAA